MLLGLLSDFIVLIKLNLVQDLVHSEDFFTAARNLDGIIADEVDDGWGCAEVHEQGPSVDHLLFVSVDEIKLRLHHLDLGRQEKTLRFVSLEAQLSGHTILVDQACAG